MIKKQNFNPHRINKKSKKFINDYSDSLGKCVGNAYILPALVNAWSVGYNAAIDDMTKEMKRKKQND